MPLSSNRSRSLVRMGQLPVPIGLQEQDFRASGDQHGSHDRHDRSDSAATSAAQDIGIEIARSEVARRFQNGDQIVGGDGVAQQIRRVAARRAFDGHGEAVVTARTTAQRIAPRHRPGAVTRHLQREILARPVGESIREIAGDIENRVVAPTVSTMTSATFTIWAREFIPPGRQCPPPASAAPDR